jgi:hypothetical protein
MHLILIRFNCVERTKLGAEEHPFFPLPPLLSLSWHHSLSSNSIKRSNIICSPHVQTLPQPAQVHEPTDAMHAPLSTHIDSSFYLSPLLSQRLRANVNVYSRVSGSFSPPKVRNCLLQIIALRGLILAPHRKYWPRPDS